MGYRFTAHFSTSFSTTSLRAELSYAYRPRATQAFAGSKPESSGILIATTTSSSVAVLRTLPEMPVSASETRGCCPAERVKTVTHIVELPDFVQDRIRIHEVRGFPEAPARGGTAESSWATTG